MRKPLSPDVAAEPERQREQERRSNGLAAQAGGWDQEEFEDFERFINEAFEQIDEELWR